MLQRDDEIGCLERDWLLPVLNEVVEEQVLTLVEEVPDQLKETAETLRELRSKEEFQDGLSQIERKRVIDDYIWTREDDFSYHVKEKEPFMNFDAAFKNLNEVPCDTREREVMFMLIHTILPYRDRISRFKKGEIKECNLCHEMVVDGLQHEFIECIFNKEVFSFIFDVFRGENIEMVSLNSKKKF